VGGDLTLYVPGEPLPGYLSLPDSVGPWAGVVVLHEAFGLNDDIRRITDRVAGLGYLAVAPDLLARGKVRCLARMLLDLGRGRGESVAQVEGLVGWLRARADCTGRVGLLGFCLGGSMAFLVGCRGDVQVSGVSYGSCPPADQLARSCPVIASYGDRDRVYRRQAARAQVGLGAASVAHDIKLYSGAGHSFMNQAEGHRLTRALTRPLLAVGFDRASSEDAWARIESFFATHLDQEYQTVDK
jgi:carboxymethylenebutenolidase